MDRAKRRKLYWAVGLAAALVAAALLAKPIHEYRESINAQRYAKDQAEKLMAYAKEHDRFTLGEVLDYDWDVAYFYPYGYGSGGQLEKFGVQIEIEPAMEETIRRLLLFKDGVLVEDLRLSMSYFDLRYDVFELFPDTVLIRDYFESGGRLHDYLRIEGCEEGKI